MPEDLNPYSGFAWLALTFAYGYLAVMAILAFVWNSFDLDPQTVGVICALATVFLVQSVCLALPCLYGHLKYNVMGYSLYSELNDNGVASAQSKLYP